jgi:hypothetical protein
MRAFFWCPLMDFSVTWDDFVPPVARVFIILFCLEGNIGV